MITRQKKQEIVNGLVELFQGAQGLYFLDFTTMTVFESQKLRRALKQADLKYKVAKNTLILRD
jgi:ribosomal protein L10